MAEDSNRWTPDGIYPNRPFHMNPETEAILRRELQAASLEPDRIDLGIRRFIRDVEGYLSARAGYQQSLPGEVSQRLEELSACTHRIIEILIRSDDRTTLLQLQRHWPDGESYRAFRRGVFALEHAATEAKTWVQNEWGHSGGLPDYPKRHFAADVAKSLQVIGAKPSTTKEGLYEVCLRVLQRAATGVEGKDARGLARTGLRGLKDGTLGTEYMPDELV